MLPTAADNSANDNNNQNSVENINNDDISDTVAELTDYL